ncbi:MAG: SMP-30/gluconolactonase/LRE family protein, partial [Planctomycetales bacterium]|nr:SMP-30/gluconolactonase/LRE family protein [Planctomycetales bacterium]
MQRHVARTAVACQNLLGEGCNWNAGNNTLLWTDIEARTVYRLTSNDELVTNVLPERAAFIFPRARGGFVLGFPQAVVLADEALSQFSPL